MDNCHNRKKTTTKRIYMYEKKQQLFYFQQNYMLVFVTLKHIKSTQTMFNPEYMYIPLPVHIEVAFFYGITILHAYTPTHPSVLTAKNTWILTHPTSQVLHTYCINACYEERAAWFRIPGMHAWYPTPLTLLYIHVYWSRLKWNWMLLLNFAMSGLPSNMASAENQKGVYSV